MFDFEWTGRSFGDQSDHERGLAAAKAYCEERGLDPAQEWTEWCTALDSGDDLPESWGAIELAAWKALTADWKTAAENVSLIWR